ncbi:MAG TPA: hypothetical protein VJ957_08575 [Longimicrobiales bacterium]|nr:hypothetical protein [Longimicrobiales bacterium]
MSGFEREIRELADHLDLPQPVRSRILLELAADLEDLAAALGARGVSEEEAHERAVASLMPSAEALAELRGLHRPLYQRLVDRFAERTRHRLERLLLTVVSAVVLGVGIGALWRVHLLAHASPFVWPLLAVAALAAVVGFGKLLQLYVVKDHAPGRLRRGMFLLPVLACAGAALGFIGLVLDFYATAGAIEADVARQGVLVLAWLRRDMAMFVLALLVTVLASLLWFVAALRVARVEQAEAESLGYVRRVHGPVI